MTVPSVLSMNYLRSYLGGRSLRNLFDKGFWAVTDQGLFALSNLIINIFLARWLSLKEYGAFAVSFSVLLLLGTLHTALLTEPLLIYGVGKYKHIQKEYFANLFRGHFYLTIAFSILLLLASFIFYLLQQFDFAYAFSGLSLAQPFVFLIWFLRRVCYTRFVPRIAALAGLGYLVLMLIGSFVLYYFRLLSPLSALMLMGFASLCVGLWMITYLSSFKDLFCGKETEKDVLATHLRYGRWSVPSSIFTWIPANIFYVLLPIVGSIELVAVLRAQSNLVVPILQFNTAISTQLIPTFVQNKDKPGYAKLINSLLAFFIITSLIYWGLLSVFRTSVIRMVYGSVFVEHNEMLLILGLLPLMTGVIAVLGGIIRAEDRPNQIFWAYFFGSVASVTIGLWLAVSGGIIGVASAILLSYAVVVVTMIYHTYFATRTQGNNQNEFVDT